MRLLEWHNKFSHSYAHQTAKWNKYFIDKTRTHPTVCHCRNRQKKTDFKKKTGKFHGNTRSLLFTCSASIFRFIGYTHIQIKAELKKKSFKDCSDWLEMGHPNWKSHKYVLRYPLSVRVWLCIFMCVRSVFRVFSLSPISIWCTLLHCMHGMGYTHVCLYDRTTDFVVNNDSVKMRRKYFLCVTKFNNNFVAFFARLFCVGFILLYTGSIADRIFFLFDSKTYRLFRKRIIAEQKKNNRRINSTTYRLFFLSFSWKQEKFNRSCNNLMCVYASHTKLHN